MKSLVEIRVSLESALGSPALFALVNTRIVLKTGVDLGKIRDGENQSEESVAKVLTALQGMGYSVEALSLVAKRTKS